MLVDVDDDGFVLVADDDDNDDDVKVVAVIVDFDYNDNNHDDEYDLISQADMCMETSQSSCPQKYPNLCYL